MLKGLPVARIGVLLLPVVSIVRPPDPTPSLQPHYEPSSLLRIGPPQCSASVLSPRGFRRLGFSLGIRATGSCSSAQKPASESRPLYAGRRLPSHQAPDRLIPEGGFTLLVLTTLASLRRVFEGFTFVRLSDAHLHEINLKTDLEGPTLISRAAYPH